MKKGWLRLLRRFKILCFCITIFSLFYLDSSAYNDNSLDITLTCDDISPINEEEFTVSLNFFPSEPLNVSAYRLKVSFDSSKFSYKGLYSYINNDDLKSYEIDGNLTIATSVLQKFMLQSMDCATMTQRQFLCQKLILLQLT